MRLRPRLFVLGLPVLCVSLLLGAAASPAAFAKEASPASIQVSLRPAAGTAAAAAPNPLCTMENHWLLYGAQFINGVTVNGIFFAWSTVSCPGGNAGDIYIGVQIDQNATKVAATSKGFTGVPRASEGDLAWSHCDQCNGTWTLTYAQILKAPDGFVFAAQQPTGCFSFFQGAYMACVAQQTVKI